MVPSPPNGSSVSRYYDRNTSWFLRASGRARSGSLHRALWGPGVHSRREALEYVDELVAAELDRRVGAGCPAHVVDLGCGVGGTAVRLARDPRVRVTGLTNSERQARLARARARHHGVAARCRIRQRDIRHPGPLAPADLAVAVESLSHVQEHECVFDGLRDCLRRGGWLVVCDDFEDARGAGDAKRRARWLRRFRRDWRLDGLRTVEEFGALARARGFTPVQCRDLSAYVCPDGEALLQLCHALELVPGHWSPVDGLRGGAAGQRCLKNGWVRYRLLVLRRG